MSISLPPDRLHASAADWMLRIDSLARSGETVEVSATLWSESAGDKFSVRFQTDGSEASLIAQARAALDQRPEREARKLELGEGMTFSLAPILPPDPEPPTDTPLPSEAYLAYRAFVDAWDALQRDLAFIAAGVLAEDDRTDELRGLVAKGVQRYRDAGAA